MTETIELTGRTLSLDELDRIARGASVAIAESCKETMAAARTIIERHLREGIAVYGLNTGLGVRASETLPSALIADFSTRMVRGRAQGWGDLLTPEETRGFLAVRLNTLLTGEAGASPRVADYLANALNMDLLPAMRRIASTGAGDLVASAAAAHAFIGEGEMLLNGAAVPAGDYLKSRKVAPIVLAPIDGHTLCNNTAFSASLAALAVMKVHRGLDALFAAVALSMEGFRSSLTPFESSVVAMRPQPGHVEAAERLRRLLDGSKLFTPGTSRRLQDPLSTRTAAQTLGSFLAELDLARTAVETEINHSSDNPAVVVAEDRVVSSANFHLSWLSLRLDGLTRAMAMAANDSVSRVHRFMTPDISGLPPLLSSGATERAGFGPLLKPAEAIRAELLHLAAPVPVLPSFNAGGIEDSAPFAALAASKLAKLADNLFMLTAFEMAAGAQALDLAAPEGVSPAVTVIHRKVRDCLPFIAEDRPVGRGIEAIAARIAEGDFGENQA